MPDILFNRWRDELFRTGDRISPALHIAVGIFVISVVLMSGCSNVIYKPIGTLEISPSGNRDYPFVIVYKGETTVLWDPRSPLSGPRKEKGTAQIFLKRTTGELRDGDFAYCPLPGNPGPAQFSSVGTIVFSGDFVDIDIGQVVDAQTGKSRVVKLEEINGRHKVVGP